MEANKVRPVQAKDTVMNPKQLFELLGTVDFTEEQGREAQAEISFKAGYEEHEKGCDDCADGFISTHERATNTVRKLGRQAGIREVVEWIKKTKIEGYDQYDNEKPIHLMYIEVSALKSKLKEWEVE